MHAQMRLERSERLRNEALYKAAVTADQVIPFGLACSQIICIESGPQMWSATIRAALPSLSVQPHLACIRHASGAPLVCVVDNVHHTDETSVQHAWSFSHGPQG